MLNAMLDLEVGNEVPRSKLLIKVQQKLALVPQMFQEILNLHVLEGHRQRLGSLMRLVIVYFGRVRRTKL